MTSFALSHKGQVPNQLGPEWRTEAEIQKLESDMQAYAHNHDVEYVSVVDASCKNHQCVTMTGDTPQSVTALDTSHLTNAGSRLAVRHMAERLLADLQTDTR